MNCHNKNQPHLIFPIKKIFYLITLAKKELKFDYFKRSLLDYDWTKYFHLSLYKLLTSISSCGLYLIL